MTHKELKNLRNGARPVRYTPIPRTARKRCLGSLSKIVREATEAGMSYGQYVAVTEPVLCASRPNRLSGWTSPARTLIESLRTEGIDVE